MLNRLQLSNDLPLFSPFPPEREKRSFRARVAAIPLESVRTYVRSSNPLASITPANILKRHDTVYGARGPFEFSDDSGNSCTWPPRANLTFHNWPRRGREGARRCKLIRKRSRVSVFSSRDRENFVLFLSCIRFVETDVATPLETVQTFLFRLSLSLARSPAEPIKESCLINDRTSGGQNRLETERQRRYSFSRYNPPHYFYRPAAMSIEGGKGRETRIFVDSRDASFLPTRPI